MRTSSLFLWEHCYDAARAGVQPMGGVTLPFIILLGGLLVGLVTARVRRHTGWRKAADILLAAVCGPAAASLRIGLDHWKAKGVPLAAVDELYAKECQTTAASIKKYQQAVVLQRQVAAGVRPLGEQFCCRPPRALDGLTDTCYVSYITFHHDLVLLR